MTREEAATLYQQGEGAVVTALVALSERVRTLETRLLALEDKLAPKPHTPSSAEPFLKPMSLRPKSGKKSGEQPGHPGSHLKKVESTEVDAVVEHRPDGLDTLCPYCGTELAGEATEEVVETRQVIDLPDALRLATTEHRLLAHSCPSCRRQAKKGSFPAWVTAPVQYGPNLAGLCVYLKVFQALSLERLCQSLTDLFGQSPEEGTIQRWINQASGALVPIEQRIATGIAAAAVAGFDETSVRCAKRTTWLHVARTEKLTHYAAPGGRGKAAMQAAGILPRFGGVAVHDAYASYFAFTGCQHSLCGAHLLREGKVLAPRFDPAGRWLEPILSWLRSTKEQAVSGRLGAAAVLEGELKSLLGAGYRALGLSPPSREGKLSACSASVLRAVRWLDRLWHYCPQVVRYGWDASTPFDNNGSERDLRPVKVCAKVFGCWRSSSGLAAFCRIRGYLSTLRKQGISQLEGLRSVFAGSPIRPRFD